jgi:hypothetical protein
LPSRRREQALILSELSQRHRPTPPRRGLGNSLVLDFSKRDDATDARARVIAWLDEINPDWPRYVKVYPRAAPQTP